MGKFLRDKEGNLVAIEGGLVLERNLDRKPRACESCGFSKWAKGDKVFIIQGGSGKGQGFNNDFGGFVGGGSMEWICPDCAITRGLPVEFYHKNFFSKANAQTRHLKPKTSTTANRGKQQPQQQQVAKGGGLPQGIEKILDMTSSLCHY